MDLVIETERLIMRELRFSDADALFILDSNPNVLRYLGGKTLESVDQSIEVIQNIRNQYIQNGIGRFAVELKNSGEVIGWAGLKFITEPEHKHVNFYDIGYRLQEKYWRNGYALEAAKAWLDHGFNTMKIPEVYASAHIDNIGSNVILQKIGMNYVEKFYYDDLPCNWYKLENKNAL